MAAFRRRVDCVLSAAFPEKRIFIQSEGATQYLRFSPLSQLTMATGGLLALAWMAVATAGLVSGVVVGGGGGGSATAVLRDAYRMRLDELAAERDQRAAEAYSAQARFETAMDRIGAQQSELLATVQERRELSTALDLMRDRLQQTVAARDAALAAGAAPAQAAEAGPSGGDLDAQLRTVTMALDNTVTARDAANAERASLEKQVADLKLRADVAARREAQMFDQINQAVTLSFAPMKQVFAKANIDLDSLLASVRTDYSGEGGPLTPVVSTRNLDNGAPNQKFDSMMQNIDQMNLLRIAVGKVPLEIPVHDAFRLTSPFGVRVDPKGEGHRMHEGVDLAAPRGTPIYATADGVVEAAGRESGYGNVVRIRHQLGFETVYAHQSKIRVKVGQQISRGDRIGDMGSTGRSTGVHLHYEVHVNGQAVNPMTYLEAAKDVF